MAVSAMARLDPHFPRGGRPCRDVDPTDFTQLLRYFSGPSRPTCAIFQSAPESGFLSFYPFSYASPGRCWGAV